MNFGESIAYWYLRLNGFFPITNYVLHRTENMIEHSADTDILAIRFPHVDEPIGGQPNDWDSGRFIDDWGIQLQSVIVGLIVEVKTGKDAGEVISGVNRAFSVERLRYGLRRLGMWSAEEITIAIQGLNNEAMYHDQLRQVVVGKLLISDYMPSEESIEKCFMLPLRDADEFIIRRINAHIDQKTSDKRFFPSDLMQYMIWKRAVSD